MGDLLDRLTEAGKCFDWISPAAAALLDLANGPSHTLLIPVGCGYSGRDVARLLKAAGVGCWGLMIPPFSDVLMVSVRKGQARWADQVLQRAGVPLLNPIASSPVVIRPAGRSPAVVRGRSRLWDLLDERGVK